MSESMKWKLTEIKYKRLRKYTLIICALGLVCYSFLVKYAMKINPDAFTGLESPFARIENGLWWIIGIGWLAVIILFIREMRKNKKHWSWKLLNKIEEDDDKHEKENME